MPSSLLRLLCVVQCLRDRGSAQVEKHALIGERLQVRAKRVRRRLRGRRGGAFDGGGGLALWNATLREAAFVLFKKHFHHLSFGEKYTVAITLVHQKNIEN